jgi:very-short-patch-repair endonuclease
MYYTAIAYGVVFLVLSITLAVLKQVIEGYQDRSGDANAERIAFPYVAADALLSAAERSFFRVLREAVGMDYHLFAKVRLADIIAVERGLSGKHRTTAFNRISSKHVDFVACHPQTFRVVGVIELDDSSHRASNSQQRDQIKNSALAAASIPILRIPARRVYSPTNLRQQVRAAFGEPG